jgi:hypothetical protein
MLRVPTPIASFMMGQHGGEDVGRELATCHQRLEDPTTDLRMPFDFGELAQNFLVDADLAQVVEEPGQQACVLEFCGKADLGGQIACDGRDPAGVTRQIRRILGLLWPLTRLPRPG